MTRTLLTAALIALAAPALAHEFTLGDLRIEHPHAFESSGSTGAGYMTLINEGHAPVALLGARSIAAPRVEIHTTEVDAAGIARMIEQSRVEIGPGETVVFAPQGLHVMFMGLAAPLAEGDRLPAELLFDKGAIAVEFWIETRSPSSPAHDHNAHGHGG